MVLCPNIKDTTNVLTVIAVRCCIFIVKMPTFTMAKFFLYTTKTKKANSKRSKVETLLPCLSITTIKKLFGTSIVNMLPQKISNLLIQLLISIPSSK